MKDRELLLSASFLSALTRLNDSLPEETQRELNYLAESISSNEDRIGSLDGIAEKCSMLTDIYDSEYATLSNGAGERSKGDAMALSYDDDPVEQFKLVLADILSSANSVVSAKSRDHIKAIQRIRQLFGGDSIHPLEDRQLDVSPEMDQQILVSSSWQEQQAIAVDKPLSVNSIDLASRGIGREEAEILRSSLSTFADDWDSPEMSIYDNYDAAKAKI